MLLRTLFFVERFVDLINLNELNLNSLSCYKRFACGLRALAAADNNDDHVALFENGGHS